MSRLKLIIGTIIALLIVVAGICFALLNPQIAQVNLWSIKFQNGSMAAYLLCAFASGVIFGLLLCVGVVLRLQSQLFMQKRELSRLQKEKSSLIVRGTINE